jgi:DNA-binding MarR family transcriptional regulator
MSLFLNTCFFLEKNINFAVNSKKNFQFTIHVRMKIDQQIQQPKFRDEYQKLLINLIFTGNYVTMHQLNVLKPFGLTPQQYNLLRILRGKHPQSISVGDVQERMIYPSSNVTRITDRLIEKGLVVRAGNRVNRRVQDLSIHESGITLLTQIDGFYDKIIEVLSNLDKKEAELLNFLLDKIREIK